MQSLTLEGKITVFKTLAISKTVDLSMMIKVPIKIIVELKKKTHFICPTKPKIKNKTICPDFKDGGLKNIDINQKIASLHCFLINRLYDDSLFLLMEINSPKTS